MYLSSLVRRNKSEAFVVGFFNLALLVILLPFMGIVMLVNTDYRTNWQSPNDPETSQYLATRLITSGHGVLELTEVSPEYLKDIPLKKHHDPFDCAVEAGPDASEQLIRYAQVFSCSSMLKDTAVTDPRTVNVVAVVDQVKAVPDPLGLASEPAVDQTVIYLVLVYVIVVAIPCLVCFWNVSKIFDSKWEETARILHLRGVKNRPAAFLLSTAPIAGLLVSYILSVVPLYVVSRVLEQVVWEGRGFLLIDALVGLIGAVVFGAVVTFVLGALTYMRRMKLIAAFK